MTEHADSNVPLPFSEAEGSQGASPQIPLPQVPGYTIVRTLGEGGMGIVYLAEQRDSICRDVALKVIKPGMDSTRVIARFEAERQTLALLEHPNIAHVFDAGMTERGRPYFAMEYVRGLPITEYCDKSQLTIRKRLELFLQVCRAIQHAHQKGIIHRDIKPSNILIAVLDDLPTAKVIDFGVARATSQPLSERTLFTERGQIIGTPEYMSPEQAGMPHHDIDTRTDVYSLGVLLYELLAGVLPFDSQTLREGGIEHIRHVICEQEPKTPSTRLSTMSGEESINLATLRRTDLRTLSRQLRGDLDWIAIRALEKDPNRRYETVNLLASDVNRYLKHEPVSAVPPSLGYRVERYVRRHQSHAVIAALASILLVVTLLSLVVGYRQTIELRSVASVMHEETLSRAREAYMKREFDRSLELARSLLDSDHVGPEARLLYASLLVEGKQLREAAATLEGLVGERPEIAGAAHSLLARVYWESDLTDAGKAREMERHQREAGRLLPETAEAYFLQALTAGTVKRTFTLLDTALHLDPSHYEARRFRALINYAATRYTEAKEDGLAMIVLRPKNSLGYVLRARACRQLGDAEEALADYDTAQELTASDDPARSEILCERLGVLLGQGEYGDVIAKSTEYLRLIPDNDTIRCCAFLAHVAVGDYQEADRFYRDIVSHSNDSRRDFDSRVRQYVFRVLAAGRDWHPPDMPPRGAAYMSMLDAQKRYEEYAAKGTCLVRDGFHPAWSPDGSKLAFSLGSHGKSGLAVQDMRTGVRELLMIPGKDPAWSPDGNQIAFVRDRQVLRLSDLATDRGEYRPQAITQEEVWIIGADGTEPRQLAQGSRPSWSADGKHLYYYSRADVMHYRIPVDGSNASPEPVLPYYSCSYCYPSVSPDEQHIAYVDYGILKIVDVSSHTVVSQWNGAPGIWELSWSPEGGHICIDSGQEPGMQTGLWIYDLQTKQAERVLSGHIAGVSYSPRGSELAFCLGPPLYEIWLAREEQDVSLDRRLRPRRTLASHLQEVMQYYADVVSADPCDTTAANILQMFAHRLEAAERPKDSQQTHAGIVFGVPRNVPAPINSPHADGMISLAGDGLTAYFASDRPRGSGALDLWYTTRVSADENWGKPVNLGPSVNSPAQEFWPSVSSDGLSLYFFSDREGGQGNGDIWVSTRKTPGDEWSSPVNLGPPVNTRYYDAAPCISADGLEFYFASNRAGSLDLWFMTRETPHDDWSEPKNLGATVNSLALDACPSLSSDGLLLVFNSTRGGDQDLYLATRKTRTDDWSLPISIGPTVNTSTFGEVCPHIAPDGGRLYFCDYPGSERPNGQGKTDIWCASLERADLPPR